MSDTSNDRKQELLMLGEIHGIVKAIQAGQEQDRRRMTVRAVADELEL